MVRRVGNFVVFFGREGLFLFLLCDEEGERKVLRRRVRCYEDGDDDENGDEDAQTMEDRRVSRCPIGIMTESLS